MAITSTTSFNTPLLLLMADFHTFTSFDHLLFYHSTAFGSLLHRMNRPSGLQSSIQAHSTVDEYTSKVASLEARLADMEKENSMMKTQLVGLSPPDSTSGSTSKRKNSNAGDAAEDDEPSENTVSALTIVLNNTCDRRREITHVTSLPSFSYLQPPTSSPGYRRDLCQDGNPLEI